MVKVDDCSANERIAEAQPAQRSPKQFLWTLLIIAGMLVVAASLVTLPRVYIAFNEWRFNRLSIKASSDPTNQNALAWADFHRDQLVAMGAYKKIQRKFANIDSASPRARQIMQTLISRNCPPSIEWLSPAPMAQRPLEIEVLCRPEDAKAWNDWLTGEEAH